MLQRNRIVGRHGTIYGHIFENAQASLSRNLFWSIDVTLAPIEVDDEIWDCSLACEWLVWPIKRVHDLDGMTLDHVVRRDLIECSIYVAAEHQWPAISGLTLKKKRWDVYELNLLGEADLVIDEKVMASSFDFRCELTLQGVVVVPTNLSPEPASHAEVKEALRSFITLDGLAEPYTEGFRHVFAPMPEAE